MSDLIKAPKWYRDYRWWIVLIMLLGSIVNYLDRVNLSIANTAVREEFGLTNLEVGFLLSAFMWPYALANLPAGWLIDKIGINRVFTWSLVVWSAATLFSGLASGFFSLYFLRMVLGVAEAPFFIIGGKITQVFFEEKKRGLVSSIINMGPKIANGFAPPLLALLIINFGWRGMFVILGVASFAVLIIWKLIYRENSQYYVINDFLQNRTKSIDISNWALFNHPTAWWFNLGNIGTSYVFWLYFTWLPTYLMDERHLSLKSAGWFTAVPFIAGVIAVPFGGWLSDRFIKLGMPTIRARLIPAVGGSLIAGIVILPVNYIQDINWAVFLITVSTFAVSARVGVLWALVGEVSSHNTVGTFGGIQNFANFVGGTLAPIGTGYILYWTNSNYNIVFIVSGILCVAGSLCYAMIKRPILDNEIAKQVNL